MTPEISIVTSVFNGMPYLEHAIQSILEQSFKNWEWILIDDGSTDRSAEVMTSFAEIDPRIRIVRQPNLGLTRALIQGCELARAPFIARQDADDTSDSKRLEKQISLIKSNSDFAFVSCFAQYIGPQNEPLEVVTRPTDPRDATEGLLNARLGPPAHGTVLFRKDVYQRAGRYRDCFYFAQDSDLWMRMAEIGQIAYVPEVLYFFRRHFCSITSSRSPEQEFYGEIGQACRRARANHQSEEPFLEQAIAKAAELRSRKVNVRDSAPSIRESYFIASQLLQNRDMRCRNYLWQILKRQPYHWRALLKLIYSYKLRDPS
jgi:glycosyltransferase involved in cell wall biosynthesis